MVKLLESDESVLRPPASVGGRRRATADHHREASNPTRLSDTAYRRLRSYRRIVEKELPGRLVDVILFGSRARGDAGRWSDYDIVVVIEATAPGELKAVARKLSDAAYDFVLQGTAIHPLPIDRAFLESASPLAFEIARDGIRIPS